MAAVDDVEHCSGAARVHVIPGRLAVMALGAVTLAGALIGGLVRLGWGLMAPAPLVAFHGPLMVAGFLGTLIGLERAIALGRRWAYAAPLASGVGALVLMLGAPGGAWLMMLGSLVMVLIFVAILRRQAALFTAIMALGAVCWWVGQILWLAGEPVHRVVFWWAGFLVLTIVGERLELTRLLRLGPAPRATIVLAVTVLVVGLAVTPFAPGVGVRVVGVAVITLALWLGLFDVARRAIRMSGLPR